MFDILFKWFDDSVDSDFQRKLKKRLRKDPECIFCYDERFVSDDTRIFALKMSFRKDVDLLENEKRLFNYSIMKPKIFNKILDFMDKEDKKDGSNFKYLGHWVLKDLLKNYHEISERTIFETPRDYSFIFAKDLPIMNSLGKMNIISLIKIFLRRYEYIDSYESEMTDDLICNLIDSYLEINTNKESE